MKKFFLAIWNYLKKTDTPLLILCVISTLYGVVLINTVVSEGSNTVFIQVLSLSIGIAAYFLFSLIDIDILADHWKLIFAVGIGMILLLLTPLASRVGGNRAWIRFWGIGVQPAEVVKIMFIIIEAKLMVYFSSRRKLNNVVSLLAMSAVFAVYFGLLYIISSDMGNVLVYLFIFVVMLFAGGLKLYWFLIAATGLVVAAPYLWTNIFRDDQRNRIIALFDPVSIDPDGTGVTWQSNQSKTAIASGGIFGTGLGNGPMTQSHSVTFQSSDFIFSAAGEELGFFGCLLIILLLTAIIVRCVYIGYRSGSKLGALISVGVASMLAFQTIENIAMCLGVGPVVGLTLPFFSSGGSSIVTNFACMGIVSGIKMKPRPVMFSDY